MRPRFLTLALIIAAISAAPATAQTAAGSGFSGSAAFAGSGAVTVHRGTEWNDRVHGDGDDRRHQRRRGQRFEHGYSDLRAGYDLNRGWASDSYNDWWHDRPDRAYPRWMSINQECERKWWSGSGWRC